MKVTARWFLLPMLIISGASSLNAQVIPDTHQEPAAETVELNPFEVHAATDSGYISKQATASGRLVQSLQDTAQNITVVNSAQIETIAPLSAPDALQYVTGLSGNNDERYSNTFVLRGFTVNGARRNGEYTNAFWGIPEAVEQYEVVRGASAVLYGSSQPGGVINYVTKTPQFTPSGVITARGFGFSDTGGGAASADFTGPIKLPFTLDAKGNPTLAYRLVLVKEDRDDYRGPGLDYFKREGLFGKLTWKPLPGLQIQSEYEYLGIHQFNGSALLVPIAPTGTPAAKVALPDAYGIPVDWTFRDQNSTYHSVERFWQTSASYQRDFGKWGKWTLRSFVSMNDHYDLRIAGPSGSAQPRAVTAADIGKVVNYNQVVTQADVDRGRLWVPARGKDWQTFHYPVPLNSQWDLTGEFETGPIKHKMLFGTNLLLGQKASYGIGQSYQQVRTFTGAPNTNYATWVDNVDHRAIAVNWDDLVSSANPTGTVTQSWGAPLRTATDINSYKFDIPWLTRKPDAFYLFDSLSFNDDRIIFGLGARHDDLYQTVNGAVQTFSQWTYRYSGLFKATSWLHVFALHNESFFQDATNANAAAAIFNRIIPPQSGKDNEVGLRFFLVENKVQIDVTGFDIRSKNTLQFDPYAAANDPDPTHRYRFIDGTTSRGVDVDITLNWGKRLQTVFGYSYQDANATPTPTQLLATPSLTSVPLMNVAKNSASALTRWEPKFQKLPGLWVTLGIRYTDRRAGGVAGSLPSYFMPGYSIVDLGGGYSFDKHWSLDFTVKNVFNKYAYRDSPNAVIVVAERPITGLATLKYRF